MPKFPLIGPSYTSQSVNADCQTTMNLYPEQIESGAGNNQIVLYPAPGTEEFVDLTLPAPPATLNPDVYNSIHVINAGLQSGNQFIGTPFVPGPQALHIGDVILLSYFVTLDNPTFRTVVAVDMTYLGTPLGPIVQIGGNVNIGLTKVLQIFYCKMAIDVPGGSNIGYTITFSGTVASHTDFQSDWSFIRNLTTFDHSASQVFPSQTSFVGPAITIAGNEFVCSFIQTENDNAQAAVLPWFAFTPNIIGAGAAYTVNVGFGNQFVFAPPGTYSPTWNSTSGSEIAGAITAAFNLASA